MGKEGLSTEEFIDEPIEVEQSATVSTPEAFVWRGRRYEVSEVIDFRQEWQIPAYAQRAKGWRLRRHRNYYTVRTADGQVFELYLDHGFGQRRWVLLRRMRWDKSSRSRQ